MRIRCWRGFTSCILSLLLGLLCLLVPRSALAEGTTNPADPAPSSLYPSEKVLDWEQFSFASLPPIQERGGFTLAPALTQQLGYDASRTWQAGSPLDSVLRLGDVQDSFGLHQFSLNQIAQITRLDLSRFSLAGFGLIPQQTIASLVSAIPNLGQFPLSQVQPIAALVAQTTGTLTLGSQTLQTIASSDLLGRLSLNNLDLSKYSFTQIPGLAAVPLQQFPGWQTSSIAGVPGLSQVPFAQFPLAPGNFLGLIARHDMTYGGDRAHKESRQTPTKFSITGSDKVGFHYNCVQAKGCDYIELNASSYSGLGALSDPGQRHGARWIRGGKGDGAQMVPGGRGILGKLNNGMEPTGRLSFGKAFKVVLTDTDESTGTGRFGLYFRVCLRRGIVNLGCTPYFIGPVPWLTTKEKGLVFVGLEDGTGGQDELPPVTQLPPEIQTQIDQITGQYGSGYSNGSSLCGSGPGGVDFKALADATSGIEGDYPSVGQWGCDGDGNCGRGLGRYQFMTYRDDVRQAISIQPGGSAFYQSLISGHAPSGAELLRYFPTTMQDSLFVNAQTQNINALISQGKAGDELVACLGEMWYSGRCSHSNGRDYTGGPTIREYGQILVANYRRALQRQGTTTCSLSSGGAKGSGKSTGKLQTPVPNAPVTSEFGPRARPCEGCSAYHLGLDFGVPDGTPVKAADGGKVIYADWMQGYGNTVVVDHGNGLMTLYAHNEQLLVKVGDSVGQGQVITRSGHSGVGTGSHLHFTVIEGATAGNVHSGHEVDPRIYLNL